MSQSFQPREASVMNVQLQVQEIVIALSDTAIVTASSNSVTIDVKNKIANNGGVQYVKSALFIDDSIPVAKVINIAHQTFDGFSKVTLNLGVPMTSSDVVILDFVYDPLNQ